MSRVEGTMSRVEGNDFLFIYLFIYLFIFEKWKTNGKQIRKFKKNKWRVDISIHISSTCWVGRRGGGRGGHVT